MCYRIQIAESTSNQLARSLEQVICYRIQIVESTSNQLMCSVEQVMCYRIQIVESTSNQFMCSVDRLTWHRTQLINLTSNRAICQMPSPCPLTFKVSSIKHWTPIPIHRPFHYPNIQHQIPTRHIPPPKEAIPDHQQTNKPTLYLYIPTVQRACTSHQQ